MFSHIRLVSAMTALATVGLLATAAAPAQASARSPAGRPAPRAQVVPGGNAETDPTQGIPAGPPVYVEDDTDVNNGVIGYFICLYNSQDECISDSTSDDSSANGVIDQTLDTIKTVADVYDFVKVANGAYKYVLKWVYHFKRLHVAPDAGSCGGDFGYDRDAIYAGCNSSSGIYWQPQFQPSGGFRWWNTYVKGDLIASSLQNDTALYVRSPADWSTWTYRPLCENTC